MARRVRNYKIRIVAEAVGSLGVMSVLAAFAVSAYAGI